MQSAASEQNLNAHIASEEAKIAALEAQITQLETEMADTQSRIDVEQGQVACRKALFSSPIPGGILASVVPVASNFPLSPEEPRRAGLLKA